jgi:prepilin-type N-terminal cleavage/methylation domain-containing protein
MSRRTTDAPVSDSRGFTLIELLMVIAVIGIVATIVTVAMVRARMAANQATAIGSFRVINSAEASYASTCARGGYAQSLEDLALEPENSEPFVPVDLAKDGISKSGYSFSIDDGTDTTLVLAADSTCNGSSEDALATYYVHAEPLIQGVTGIRSFGSDNSGTIYQQLDGDEVGNTFESATPLK